MYCTYLEGIEPRGSYYCPNGFLYEQNRISMLLLLPLLPLLVLGATVRRVVSNWHDLFELVCFTRRRLVVDSMLAIA